MLITPVASHGKTSGPAGAINAPTRPELNAPHKPSVPHEDEYRQRPRRPYQNTGSHQASGGADLVAYYRDAEGKKGGRLLWSLHNIIRAGHVDQGYAQARNDLFETVANPNGDRQIRDVFTGKKRGPIRSKEEGFDKGLNTEHVWPQSKGATGIARSDLHHLFPGDILTNAKRASFPYGEVNRVLWTAGSGATQAKLGVDLLGRTVFEPADSMKGDIARSLMYFYTRYQQSKPAKFNSDHFKVSLPSLLKWHVQDPVSDEEAFRNNAVQKAQGNRNPFIDRPSFVDDLDFQSLTIERRNRYAA